MSATLRIGQNNFVRDALWDSSRSVLGAQRYGYSSTLGMRCAALGIPSADTSRSGAATLGAMEMGACASVGALMMGALASVGAMMMGALASGARGMGASPALGAMGTGVQVRWSYGMRHFFGSSIKLRFLSPCYHELEYLLVLSNQLLHGLHHLLGRGS